MFGGVNFLFELFDNCGIYFYGFFSSLLLMWLGLFGCWFNRKNLILMLLSIELIYTGLILNFLILGLVFADMKVQIYSFVIVVNVAIESVLGLGLIIALNRLTSTITTNNLAILNG